MIGWLNKAIERQQAKVKRAADHLSRLKDLSPNEQLREVTRVQKKLGKGNLNASARAKLAKPSTKTKLRKLADRIERKK
jgi:hypothetical protein